ncbi:MAG TPA: arginine deiminase family protein [Nitrospiria bacterium]|jgi:N-dimethylarginine dimethylaminohydrolase|nr:arginine deiminase family protein [Nitrospiria bacterium]
MPSFLMCPPDYYQIEYEINPWMNRRRPAEPVAAMRQWRALYDLLTTKLGATVELLSPAKGLPDLVFTANAGLVSGGKFIQGRFRFPQRQREAPLFEAWFKKKAYQIFPLPEEACFEGEGDALPFGKTLFAGYRMRSDIQSHRTIGEILACEVLSLELVDSRFYHLDTCFCPLTDRAALYFPPAFDDYGRKVIAASVPEAIPVVPEEALRFACNAIVIGNEVVLHSGCDATNRELRRRGVKVHELDLSEFHRAGGSAKCMVLRLS